MASHLVHALLVCAAETLAALLEGQKDLHDRLVAVQAAQAGLSDAQAGLSDELRGLQVMVAASIDPIWGTKSDAPSSSASGGGKRDPCIKQRLCIELGYEKGTKKLKCQLTGVEADSQVVTGTQCPKTQEFLV